MDSTTDEKIVSVPYFVYEGDRAIIKRRLLDGITYERLDEEFDLSVRQTKTIVKKCSETIYKHV